MNGDFVYLLTALFRAVPHEARDILVKLLLAVVLSGAIGLERQRKGRPAGLRTNILVCMGSTLVMALGASIGEADVRSRIAAGIVTGVGFLGAGAIITSGARRHGLTTAAMIWFVATLGIAIGADKYALATISALHGLIIVIGLQAFEHHLRSRGYFVVTVDMPAGIGTVEEILGRFKETDWGRVRLSSVNFAGPEGAVRLEIHLTTYDYREFARLAEGLRARFPEAHFLDIKEWAV